MLSVQVAVQLYFGNVAARKGCALDQINYWDGKERDYLWKKETLEDW